MLGGNSILAKWRPVKEDPPLFWTSELYAELCGAPRCDYDLQCFIGIERLDEERDFSRNIVHNEPEFERIYSGFVGSPADSKLKYVRAQLIFEANAEFFVPYTGKVLPKTSAGYGETVNWNYSRPPSITIRIFASAQFQRTFEEWFIRARLFGTPHIPISIWAKTLEPNRHQSSKEFVRAFSIQRVFIEQHLHLNQTLDQSDPGTLW